jgi:predicted nucleic-acid-binding protein
MRIVDANIVLRYILDDHAELSVKAKEIVENNAVTVPIEVLCEVVFVLSGMYGISRIDISSTLIDFFEQTNCMLPHRGAVLKGLEFFSENKLDFVDCLLAGYSMIERVEVYTFDQKLQKLLAKT